jgi:hypothetical protein
LWIPTRSRIAALAGPDLRAFLALAGLAAAAACASVPQRIAEENMAAVQPNRTTQTEVRTLLGPPARIDQNARMQREIWTYRVFSQPQHKELYLQFSADGVVRESYLVPDPEELSRSLR